MLHHFAGGDFEAATRPRGRGHRDRRALRRSRPRRHGRHGPGSRASRARATARASDSWTRAWSRSRAGSSRRSWPGSSTATRSRSVRARTSCAAPGVDDRADPLVRAPGRHGRPHGRVPRPPRRDHAAAGAGRLPWRRRGVSASTGVLNQRAAARALYVRESSIACGATSTAAEEAYRVAPGTAGAAAGPGAAAPGAGQGRSRAGGDPPRRGETSPPLERAALLPRTSRSRSRRRGRRSRACERRALRDLATSREATRSARCRRTPAEPWRSREARPRPH